jgi:hypothetical protein
MIMAIVKRILLTACLLWTTQAGAETQEWPSFSAGGLLFGDLYYVPSNHLEAGDGAAGLVIRRGYLTFDADFSSNWFGRMRFELNQSGEFETYTFVVNFKDLYLGWNLGRQQLLLGLSPTPTFDLIESIWGLRYLARTPMDMHGVASRDTGISIKGPLNASGSISYRAMLGTKVEFGNETDDSKKWMGALTWKPSPKWSFDLYTDHEELTGLTDRTTFQAFVGYKTDTLAWGAQYSHQDREEDPTLELASAFVTNRVGEITTLIGRVDRIMQPSPKGDNISYLPFDPTAPATMFMAGVQFQASPHIFIIPNTVVTYYDQNDEGVRPKTDVYLRLTLFFNFE